MSFDLAAHIGAMSRSVRNFERDGQPASAVVAWRTYDTDAADLWDALTNAERLPRWFATVTGDLKLGGHYQVQNNAGGTITTCEPERKIALTWEFGGAVSWVTVTLSPDGDGTRLELEHVAYDNPYTEPFGPGAVGVGWDLAFMGMARHLAEPAAFKPQEIEAEWAASDEAKNFIRHTSDAWGAAAIAAGTDRDKALKGAEATRQFYTGETPPSGH